MLSCFRRALKGEPLPIFRSCIKQLLLRSTFPLNMATVIGVVQMQVNEDKIANFNCAKQLILGAVGRGAQFVFLPECFDFIGTSKQFTVENSEPLNGPLITQYKNLAAEKKLWISLGGAHRKLDDGEGSRVANTHIVIDETGEVVATYDKVHMFDISISGDSDTQCDSSSFNVSESSLILPGRSVPSVIHNTPVGSLGLAICYDMRFPELASHLRYAGGAQVLTYPSAFTVSTGRAGHWHTLLRARAIENQCYVVAAAQEGVHDPKRSSYGHSVVIDPWGQVVAEQLNPGPGLLVCELQVASKSSDSSASIWKVRQSVPIEHHRRSDLFLMQDSGYKREIGSQPYMFGPHRVEASCVFYRSALSFAFVNLSPLVPGHVLVSPAACCPRFDDLSPAQLADLYLTVKQIARRLSTHFNSTSLTVSIQDGKDAGQSVPHVHVHILPRKPNDFAQNDYIYQALQQHDKVANRVYRSLDEMAAEAAEFRKMFYLD